MTPSPSHRLRLRVSEQLLEKLEERAEASGLRLASQVKRAIERGLDEQEAEPVSSGDVVRLELIALAALIAAEQVGRFLVRHYPQGEQRMLEVRESAVEQAEQRLPVGTDVPVGAQGTGLSGSANSHWSSS